MRPSEKVLFTACFMLLNTPKVGEGGKLKLFLKNGRFMCLKNQ